MTYDNKNFAELYEIVGEIKDLKRKKVPNELISRLINLGKRTMKLEETLYKAAHNLSFRSRHFIESSNVCGCFYCLKVFHPGEIEEWVDKGGTTALCPKCGIDSVLPDNCGVPLSREFLVQMHNRYFRTSHRMKEWINE